MSFRTEMKESIIIKNLGPIKNIEINDIRPMTVLIGESGSGKSLLMKCLILFRYIYKMLNIRWYLKNAGVNKSRFHLKMEYLLSPELKEYFANKSLEVEYSVAINGRSHSVIYRNGKIIRNFTDKTIPNEDLVFLKESWISEMRNIIPAWAASGNTSKKNSLRGSRVLDFYFQETYNDFQDATNVIKDCPLKYLGVNLAVENKSVGKTYWFYPSDKSYPKMELKYGSSGLQTSSSIMTLVRYFSGHFSFRDAISRSIINYLYETDSLRLFKPELEPNEMKKIVQIHIEEPELNLFPQAQCNLIEDIVDVAFNEIHSDREIGLMMATHSPYIVNYLNVLLHKKKDGTPKICPDDLAVYRIYEGTLQNLMCVDENGNVYVDTYDLTEPMEDIMNEYDELI